MEMFLGLVVCWLRIGRLGDLLQGENLQTTYKVVLAHYVPILTMVSAFLTTPSIDVPMTPLRENGPWFLAIIGFVHAVLPIYYLFVVASRDASWAIDRDVWSPLLLFATVTQSVTMALVIALFGVRPK